MKIMGQEIFSAFNSTATNIFILTNIFLLLYSNIHSILVFVHQHNTVFVYFLFFQNFITCFIDETFFSSSNIHRNLFSQGLNKKEKTTAQDICFTFSFSKPFLTMKKIYKLQLCNRGTFTPD